MAKNITQTENKELTEQQNEARKYLTPDVDIRDLNEHYEVYVDMPGVLKEDVEVTTEGNTLRIRGKRSDSYQHLSSFPGQTWFSRDLSLGYGIDRDKIEAKLQDGVLRLTLTKNDQSKTRKIDIN